MLTKKKPFPGDDPEQKLDFSKMGKKKDIENAKDAKKPGDKKEDAKKKGKKKPGKWAKKAALSLVK